MKKVVLRCCMLLFLVFSFTFLSSKDEFISVEAAKKKAMCSFEFSDSGLVKVTNHIDYDIVYETNGGDKISNGKVSIFENSILGSELIPTPVRKGYVFEGWYYDETFTNRVTATTTSGIVTSQSMKPIDCLTGKGTIKVYAKWVKIIVADICEAKQFVGGSYNVKYNTNGGNTISSVKVGVGAEPTQFGELPIPKKDGYTFAGWYYDSNFKEPVTAKYNAGVGKVEHYKEGNCEYVRYKDVTLYAKWVEKFMSVELCEAKQFVGGSYNVKYNTNGGNTISSVKVGVGAEPTQFGELPIPKKDGYTFAGWYYDSDFKEPVTAKYNAGVGKVEHYKDGNCEYARYKDVTLYAKWVSKNELGFVCSNEPIIGGVATINYVPNNGETITSSKLCTGCQQKDEKLPKPTKEGYIFAGWYYDSNFTRMVNGDKVRDVDHSGEKYDKNGCLVSNIVDVTLYAKWVSKNELEFVCSNEPIIGGAATINYEPNNGEKIASSKLCTGCQTNDEKLPIPTKEGYIFAGWYYDSNFTRMVNGDKVRDVDHSGEKYDKNGCLVSNIVDVTLYAKWVSVISTDVCPEPINGGSFNLEFNANGGSEIEKMSVCIGCDPTLTKLPIPTKEGYTFGGWYYDADFNDQVAVIYAVDVDHIEVTEENGCVVYKNIDRTLYARWQKVYKEKDVELIIDEKMASNINRVEIKQLPKEDKSMILLNKKLIKFNAYEINLLDANNSKVQPNGKVILKFPFDKSININNLVVYRVDGDKLVLYDPIIIDGYAQIETDHFGIYAVGEEKSVSNPETSDNILIYVSFGILFVVGSIIITKKLKYSK